VVVNGILNTTKTSIAKRFYISELSPIEFTEIWNEIQKRYETLVAFELVAFLRIRNDSKHQAEHSKKLLLGTAFSTKVIFNETIKRLLLRNTENYTILSTRIISSTYLSHIQIEIGF